MKIVQGLRYRWSLPELSSEQVFGVASKHTIAVPIAQVLVARGMVDDEEIASFLLCDAAQQVHNSAMLKDAEKAIERIEKAIRDKEKILIFGDYDVDGITSSSLMMCCLQPLGAQVNFYLPHRVKDGYGISSAIVQRAARSGYSLIITVDNGITAIEPARMAKECGVDLIITDHHRPQQELPDAYAIVNPNQDDCDYPFKHLAGVGVSFKLMSLLYERRGIPLPERVYELLLLGTIADVVPLQGENRYWTRYGLRHINQTPSLAVKVLTQNAQVSKPRLSSLDIGFSLAPQINALGRLEDPRDGVRFLLGSQESEVERIGAVLYELNRVRKEIERSIFDQVAQQVESGLIDINKRRTIVSSSDAWPPGVIGLVASKLVGTYVRPTILLHETPEGLLKGSCRSIPAFNLFAALEQSAKYLKSFGGHSHAAGLSLYKKNFDPFCESIERCAQEWLSEDDLAHVLSCDATLRLPDLDKKLLADLQHLEPFGHENRSPFFVLNHVSLAKPPRLLKDAHVKCVVAAEGVVRNIIFFNRPELHQWLEEHGHEPFSIAGQVSENHWNGRVNVEMIGTDVAPMQEAV